MSKIPLQSEIWHKLAVSPYSVPHLHIDITRDVLNKLVQEAARQFGIGEMVKRRKALGKFQMYVQHDEYLPKAARIACSSLGVEVQDIENLLTLLLK